MSRSRDTYAHRKEYFAKRRANFKKLNLCIFCGGELKSVSYCENILR